MFGKVKVGGEDKQRHTKSTSVTSAIKTEQRKGERKMEDVRTEEQMKEIQEAITYCHELLERNEMLEKRNQAMLKKIRQEKKDKLKAELCCKVYAIIAVVATIFGFGMAVGRCLAFLTTMGF